MKFGKRVLIHVPCVCVLSETERDIGGAFSAIGGSVTCGSSSSELSTVILEVVSAKEYGSRRSVRRARGVVKCSKHGALSFRQLHMRTLNSAVQLNTIGALSYDSKKNFPHLRKCGSVPAANLGREGRVPELCPWAELESSDRSHRCCAISSASDESDEPRSR